MSTLHSAATRLVSYALVPAALALSAAAAWAMQPPPLTSPGHLKSSDVASLVAALPVSRPEVAIAPAAPVAPDVIAVPKAVPKPTAVPKPVAIAKAAVLPPAPADPLRGLTRYCDDHQLSGSDDKVRICTWR